MNERGMDEKERNLMEKHEKKLEHGGMRVIKQGMRMLASLAIIAGALAAAYLLLVRPENLKWGTRADEAHRRLPGDEFVSHPDYSCTHAVSIRAPISSVWPWLVQIGQDRGGFYSYTLFENLMGLEMRNATRIVPEWQARAKEDKIHLSPNTFMEIIAIETPRHIVCDMPMAEKTSWAFILEPVDPSTTRLVIRMRTNLGSVSKLERAFFRIGFDAGHFVMERKMMTGIKERAEKERGIASHYFLKELIWFALLMLSLVPAALVFFSPKGLWRTVFSSLFAVSWVMLFFRGYMSLFWGALLLAGSIGAAIACKKISNT